MNLPMDAEILTAGPHKTDAPVSVTIATCTMPHQAAVAQIRLNNITICLSAALRTLELLSESLNTPFLIPISGTTRALLICAQTIKQNKNDCTQLLEHTHNLLNAIIMVHIASDTGREMSPTILKQIGKFTEYLTLGEMSRLLKDCRTGLQQGLNFFKIENMNLLTNIENLQQEAEHRHQQVLNMIELLSDATGSENASSINRVFSGSYNSSNSVTMLPSEPKIFHGRETELLEILKLFHLGTPRIAILGAGTQVELAALIGAHLGQKPGKDMTQPVVHYFRASKPSLLVLDNLETP
ncbi:hypothetical protein K438DRAFT_1758513 [Mycena galopus ATCC 62051]|nr:hypothetical protein K438DRAFT_1758513 [Mycena galopus ATCC 62051]